MLRTTGRRHPSDLADAAPGPREPTMAEMMGNAAGALLSWTAAGFPVRPADERAAIMAICQSCPIWDPGARGGLGKCGKCGCTRFKPWLATESCPLGKWGHKEKEK